MKKAFEEKMSRSLAKLRAQFGEPARLERAFQTNFMGLGYGA